MEQVETNENERNTFQQEWEASLNIEDARRNSLKHIDELFHEKETASKLKADDTTAFKKECEQGYPVEESRKYVLNRLRSIWKDGF